MTVPLAILRFRNQVVKSKDKGEANSKSKAQAKELRIRKKEKEFKIGKQKRRSTTLSGIES